MLHDPARGYNHGFSERILRSPIASRLLCSTIIAYGTGHNNENDFAGENEKAGWVIKSFTGLVSCARKRVIYRDLGSTSITSILISKPVSFTPSLVLFLAI